MLRPLVRWTGAAGW